MTSATPSARPKDFEVLFQGAARLGVLCAATGLPWPSLAPFVSTFVLPLNDYQEISVDGTGETLGIMTRGNDKAFAFTVCSYMESCGVDKERLRRFLIRARFLKYRNLFFKVEFGQNGPSEFSYYFRQPASLHVARAWFADTVISPEDIDRIDACASLLEKRNVHFLGTAEGRSKTHAEKVYFSQPAGMEAWNRTLAVGELLELIDSDWDPLHEVYPSLISESFFVSMALGDRGDRRSMKLDFQGVRPDTATVLMSSVGLAQEEVDSAMLLLSLFEKESFDYLGLRLRHGRAPAVKVYAYSSSSQSLETARLN